MIMDYGVSDDCINYQSYGEICVHCGCCSYNQNYRDRTIRKIRLYKEMLAEEKAFNNWITGCEELQRKNVNSNINYFKKHIRINKKILNTLRRG